MKNIPLFLSAAAVSIFSLSESAATAVAVTKSEPASPTGMSLALPPAERVLATLRADHPRIMARPETFVFLNRAEKP